jgi:hypothetical protein
MDGYKYGGKADADNSKEGSVDFKGRNLLTSERKFKKECKYQ